MRGASIGAPFPEVMFHIYHFSPRNLKDLLGIDDDKDLKLSTTGRMSVDLFARSLAKIGYCHTVVRYGLGNFRPLLLPKIILGECPSAPYFVGVPLDTPPPPFGRTITHAIQLVELVSKTGPLKLYLAKIRLFASSSYQEHGLPTYYVITGAPPLHSPSSVVYHQ